MFVLMLHFHSNRKNLTEKFKRDPHCSIAKPCLREDVKDAKEKCFSSFSHRIHSEESVEVLRVENRVENSDGRRKLGKFAHSLAN